jgi:D-alanyl-D-alanine carboxypeptidase
MSVSYNGWSASPSLALRDCTVAGVSAVPGVRDNDDVYVVLHYVMEQWHERVEALVPGWCWGFNFRPTTNDNSLSCHASGTAIDLNAPRHPFGVSPYANLNQQQIDTIHEIIADLPIVWGGDYRDADNKDAMHFEIMGSAAAVAAAADRIRNGDMEDEMKQEDFERIREIVRSELDSEKFITKVSNKVATAVWGRKFEVVRAGKKVKENASVLLKEIWARK